MNKAPRSNIHGRSGSRNSNGRPLHQSRILYCRRGDIAPRLPCGNVCSPQERLPFPLAGRYGFLPLRHLRISDIRNLIGGNAGDIRALAMQAKGWAGSLKEVIDDLPFRNAGTAPLLKALLTGDRSGLSDNVVRNFREGGASHILALSGLHLGIIYLFIRRALLVIGNSPPANLVRSLATIILSGLYTLATGASPSLVRAFLFIILNESARLLHRNSRPERVLCAALTIQIAMNPGAITSPGFQLSYLAMGGIMFLFPILRTWFAADGDFPVMKRIWDSAALAISCQVFTAPAGFSGGMAV